MLAHILGRLPCPKKTPRKIGNSMLAQYQYRMKIRKAENYCRIVSCATKICKNRHKLANCNAIRTHHNGEIVKIAEASTALWARPFDMAQCPGLWCSRNVIFTSLATCGGFAELIYFGAVVQLTILQQFCRYDVYE